MGQLLIRLPDEMHQSLKAAAALDGDTLQRRVQLLIEAYICQAQARGLIGKTR